MEKDLREKIRAATEESGITKPDFIELLKLIDQHYDRMEATITQSLQSQTLTPLEAIFESVTEALLSVGEDGVIRRCNKVCTRYFDLPKDRIEGMFIGNILPGANGVPLREFLMPYMSNLDDTNVELSGGEVDAQRGSGEKFLAEINASEKRRGIGNQGLNEIGRLIIRRYGRRVGEAEDCLLTLVADGVDVGHVVGQDFQSHLLNQRTGRGQIDSTTHGLDSCEMGSCSFLNFFCNSCAMFILLKE